MVCFGFPLMVTTPQSSNPASAASANVPEAPRVIWAEPPTVTWEKLPDDYALPDDPVDNIYQPALAAALTESLKLAGRLPEASITVTNYGICATVNGTTVVKAPDWAYIPHITVSRQTIARSYTPHLQGETPAIVIEFLSSPEGTEYSVKETYPPGKFFFYERILKVPNYGLLDLEDGSLEFYRLDRETGRYNLETPNQEGRFWVPEMELWLGCWWGRRENLPGTWLRWWDADDSLLLWDEEMIQQERQRADQERQRAEQERQRAEQERQRAERLMEQLRAAGLEPDADP
jgi:hypothetical protein